MDDRVFSILLVFADIVFTRSWSAAWLDPANWKMEGLVATDPVPHLERIPCTHDHVVFPEGSSFRVRLPEVAVTVGTISLLGQVLWHHNSSHGHRNLVLTGVGSVPGLWANLLYGLSQNFVYIHSIIQRCSWLVLNLLDAENHQPSSTPSSDTFHMYFI
jgi:hypothetical protein